MPSLPDRCDVAIVGAGVIGLATAYYCARDGRRVCVFDRDQPGAATSWGNCGLITPSHGDPLTRPDAIGIGLRSVFDPNAPVRFAPTADLRRLAWFARFARRCTAAHRERARDARFRLLTSARGLLADLIREEEIDCGFVEGGVLVAFLTEAAIEHEERALAPAERHGMAGERLSAAEVREREPALAEVVCGGLLNGHDAHLDPRALTRGLAAAAARRGATVLSGCGVQAIEVDAGRVRAVRSEGGRVPVGQVVLCAGPWSGELLRPHGMNLPLQPVKGYSVTWERPHGVLRGPVIFHERHVVATPWRSGWRLGSTLEFAGFDARMNERRIGRLFEAADEFLRAPTARGGGQRWFGYRPMSVDEIPMLGPSRRIAGLFMGCGHGQLGISMAAASGKLLAEITAGVQPHLDPSDYAPGRFGL